MLLLNFFRKYNYLFLVIIITLLIGLPGIFINWSFVDDGVNILIAKKIHESLFISQNFNLFLNTIIEPENGRLRPVFWLIQYLLWLFSGQSALLRHLLQLFILVVIAILSGEIIYKTTKKKLIAVLAITIWLVSSVNNENWYRLGPQELPTLLLLLASLFLFLRSIDYFARKKIKRKFYTFSLTLIPLILLTKETNVIIPLLCFFNLLGLFFFKPFKFNHLKALFIYMGISVIVSLLVIFGVKLESLQTRVYASAYSLSLQSIIDNTKSYLKIDIGGYSPLIFVGFLSLFIWLIFIKDSKQFGNRLFWVFFWGVWFASFLLIQIPWGIVLPRYLVVANLGLSVLLAWGIIGLLDFISQKFNTRLTQIVFFIYAITVSIYLLYNFFGIRDYLETQIIGTNSSESLLSYLACNINENENLVMNFPNNDTYKELVFETGLHLNLFYNRFDLKPKYIKETNLKSEDWVIGLKPVSGLKTVALFDQDKHYFELTDADTILLNLRHPKRWIEYREQDDVWYVQRVKNENEYIN